MRRNKVNCELCPDEFNVFPIIVWEKQGRKKYSKTSASDKICPVQPIQS